jgi:hypothetical protein
MAQDMEKEAAQAAMREVPLEVVCARIYSCLQARHLTCAVKTLELCFPKAVCHGLSKRFTRNASYARTRIPSCTHDAVDLNGCSQIIVLLFCAYMTHLAVQIQAQKAAQKQEKVRDKPTKSPHFTT